MWIVRQSMPRCEQPGSRHTAKLASAGVLDMTAGIDCDAVGWRREAQAGVYDDAMRPAETIASRRSPLKAALATVAEIAFNAWLLCMAPDAGNDTTPAL